MEVQRAQKAPIEVAKENKEVNVMKSNEQKSNALDKTKASRRGKHITNANTVEILMNHRGAQPVARTVQSVKNE